MENTQKRKSGNYIFLFVKRRKSCQEEGCLNSSNIYDQEDIEAPTPSEENRLTLISHKESNIKALEEDMSRSDSPGNNSVDDRGRDYIVRRDNGGTQEKVKEDQEEAAVRETDPPWWTSSVSLVETGGEIGRN